jgi:hypothetical protein
VKASTWCLKTGTFRLGETTPTENPGPPGWGLGTSLTALSCKNVVVNLQLEKPQTDEQRQPVRRNRYRNWNMEREKSLGWISTDVNLLLDWVLRKTEVARCYVPGCEGAAGGQKMEAGI